MIASLTNIKIIRSIPCQPSEVVLRYGVDGSQKLNIFWVVTKEDVRSTPYESGTRQDEKSLHSRFWIFFDSSCIIALLTSNHLIANCHP